MKIAIAADTNSGITQEKAEKLGIRVVPMPFIVGGEEFKEGDGLSAGEFFRRQEAGEETVTSQSAPADLMTVWDDLLRDHDAIVYIPMTEAMSGSYQTAQAVAQDYQGRVFVVNNKAISVTERQSVLDALALADAGFSPEQIREILERRTFEASIYLTVDTLKYLKKGGRITPAVAAIGTLLRIKPVLQIRGKKVDSFAKARTMKQARAIMLAAVDQDLKDFGDPAGENSYIMAAHTSPQEVADAWAEEIRAHYPKNTDFHMDPLSLHISCHTGANSLAMACMKKLDIDEERRRYGL